MYGDQSREYAILYQGLKASRHVHLAYKFEGLGGIYSVPLPYLFPMEIHYTKRQQQQ